MEENLHPAPQYTAPRAALDFDSRDRLLLLLVLPAAYLFQELLRGLLAFHNFRFPALGACLCACLTVGLVFWYARERCPLRGAHLTLLIPALLLCLSLALYAPGPLSAINLLAAPALLFLWALSACGILAERRRWTLLVTGFVQSYAIRWKHVDKPVRALATLFRRRSLVWLWVLAGIGGSLFLLFVLILPLLRSADMVFDQYTGNLLTRFLTGGWSSWLLRLFWALCLAFLIYSALYALRHDAPRPVKAPLRPALPPALPITILLSVNAVYLLFVGVQFAYLFGGTALLESRGLSYASYARSGFFQLVFIALLNLSLCMLAQTLAKKEKKSDLALRLLAGLLLLLTAVILASAVFRMCMYVSAYGLSLLRALTFWGMALIALWLVFAAWKLVRPEARFFPLLFRSAVIAWALLSLCNLNGLVARFNTAQYQAGQVETLDVDYLRGLGPAALPALESLWEDRAASPADGENFEAHMSGSAQIWQALSASRTQAREDCADWRSWNLQSAILSASSGRAG